MKAIENATKEANAYDFIKNLPSGLDTNCGKKGSQLSGKTLVKTDLFLSVSYDISGDKVGFLFRWTKTANRNCKGADKKTKNTATR